MSYTRFALYYLPPEGDLAAFGAAWLGWNVALGQPTDQFSVPELDDVTATARKYGFHATLKPPFRLKDPHSAGDLAEAVAQMATSCAPARCEGLQIGRLGSFLALTPVGEVAGIARIAAQCVVDIDPFRAEASAADLARRRVRLSERQDALLTRWGYPYVLDEFDFHLTLTGRLAPKARERWCETLKAYLPPLPTPFVIDEIALAGERQDGRFELIRRYRLTG
ncbi:DUF1045 domain-containing protein [Rhodobacteraceae bacterium LMO-12]|nr:DUF1045 domain-containing protein [Rhodobacteraceae bacterium LMO-JJ12]